jgi:phage gp29-like protein
MFKFRFKKTPATEPETNYNLRSEPPSIASQLNVDRVFAVTQAAETGNVRDLFTLYRDMIIADSHTQGEISKRKLAVLGDRMTVHPWDKTSPADKLAAASVETMIHNCKSWTQACIHLLDGSLYPVAVVEKVFTPAAGGYALRDLVPVPHYLLDYSSGRMMINDVADSGTILSTSHEPSPERYIIHRGHLLTTPDTWGGPMRSILYWWLLATMSRDWWSRFLDRYGSPFIIGHYPQGDDKSRNVLRAAFSMATRLGGLVVTDKTRVEIIQASQSSSGDSYEKFITICNREKSKLILGQTLSAEAQPTGLGEGTSNMQEGVRQDIRMWDAASLAGTFRQQLFDQYLQINNMSATTPTLTWGSVSVAELKGKADLLVSLKQAGYRLTDDELGTFSEEIGMSLERDPAAAIGGGSPAPFIGAYAARSGRC